MTNCSRQEISAGLGRIACDWAGQALAELVSTKAKSHDHDFSAGGFSRSGCDARSECHSSSVTAGNVADTHRQPPLHQALDSKKPASAPGTADLTAPSR